jgi:hypothetical protein
MYAAMEKGARVDLFVEINSSVAPLIQMREKMQA